jgi:hypothetical protein
MSRIARGSNLRERRGGDPPPQGRRTGQSGLDVTFIVSPSTLRTLGWRMVSSRIPWREMLVGLGVLMSACVAVWATRVPGGIALFWPSSAIAAALLIRFPNLRCGWTALAVLAAFVVANLIAAHRPLALAALFGLVNATEIALMVLAFRFVKAFPYPMITISQAAVMTAVFGIAIPGLVAMIGGLPLHTELRRAPSCGGPPTRLARALRALRSFFLVSRV